MVLKKDLKEMFVEADEKWDKRFAKLRKELKNDIETAVAQIIEFVMKYAASKEDLKEFKEEVKLEFRDTRRQINDLKADTPAPQEFAGHEKRIANLEAAVFPTPS